MSKVKIDNLISKKINDELKAFPEDEVELTKYFIMDSLYSEQLILNTEVFGSLTKERVEKTINEIKKELAIYLKELQQKKKSYDNDWSISEVTETLVYLNKLIII